MKPERGIRARERVKSLLIMLLSLSAVFLMVRILAYAQVSNRATGWVGDAVSFFLPGRGEEPGPTGQPSAAAFRPVRMAVCSGAGRYGVQYETERAAVLFEALGGLLGQALGSAKAPRPVDEEDWRAALSRPGVYCDFLEAVSLRTLEGQLGGAGENAFLAARARRLVLAMGAGETATLYYSNEADGMYYACETGLEGKNRLNTAVASYAPNNAVFAFEMPEQYGALAPYVMILSETPSPAVYEAKNPLSGLDETGRATLLRALSFRAQAVTTYPTAEGFAVREGGDTLRIAADGTVTFQAEQGGQARYPLPQAEDGRGEADWLEAARQVAQRSVGAWCGGAQLYLMELERGAGGVLTAYFGYLLDGAPVQFGSECYAARLVLEDGAITEYTLRFRAYQRTAQKSVVLPELQAVAALEALAPEGKDELGLCYFDFGGETVRADWAAI